MPLENGRKNVRRRGHVLKDYPGTLILVGHDRDVLDRLATGIIALEGDGRAREYAGGYSDYLTQRRARPDAETISGPQKSARRTRSERPKRAGSKLGYKEQRELETLPGELARLEAEVGTLRKALADPGFFARDRAAFEDAAARLETARARLTSTEERWLDLETRREELAAATQGKV